MTRTLITGASSGIGAGLVLAGKLYRGITGIAGEIGHVPGFGDARCTCGQTGHLETIAGARGIGLLAA